MASSVSPIRLLTCAMVLAVFLLGGCQTSELASVDSGMTLLDIHDEHVAPLRDPADANARVLIFITVECPIANGYAPEINRLVTDYSSRGVSFTLVQVDRDLTVAQALEHARAYGFKCEVVLDPEHRLVKAIGATVTPEAAVMDSSGRMAYRGRIDDQYAELGKKHMEASIHDLAAAIDAVLQGEPVAHPRTKAIGCFISEPAK